MITASKTYLRMQYRAIFAILIAGLIVIGSSPIGHSQELPRITASPARSQVIATNYPGSDIGAQVNAAYASCGGQCSVSIPQGTYVYATTIQIPIKTMGGPGLVCDSTSTTLRYTGGGDAVAAFGFGDSQAGLVIRNCTLDGGLSQSGANGLHLRSFGGGTVENIRIFNFSGAGLLNSGANAITFIGADIEANYIDVHNVGVVVNGQGWSANSNKMYGGTIGYAKKWGLYEDSSEVSQSFPNGGNVYDGVVFERNGTNNEVSGNAFLQWCDGCVITNSYLEFFGVDHVPENVVIGGTNGDAVGGVEASPQGIKIVNNHLLSDNCVDSILILNARMAIVENNSEVGNPTNFVNMKSDVQWSYVGHNLALAATNPVVNTDTGNTGNGVAPGTDTANSNAPTTLGYAFNDLTGYTSDLSIVDRPGGAHNLVGLDANGNLIYQIYTNGVGKFPGLMVDNSGLTFNTAQSHILTVGGNNMLTGVIQMIRARTTTVQFSGQYNTPPNCTLTPRQNMNLVSWWVQTSPTSVTVNTNIPVTAAFTYFCVGDAN